MPQKVTFNGDTSDKPVAEFRVGEAGVITAASGSASGKIGDPFIRAGEMILIPTRDSIGCWSRNLDWYRGRPLKPGERIVIEGVE